MLMIILMAISWLLAGLWAALAMKNYYGYKWEWGAAGVILGGQISLTLVWISLGWRGLKFWK